MKKTIVHVVTTMNRGGLESLVMTLYKYLNEDYHFVFIVQKRGHHHYFDEIANLGGTVIGVYRESLWDYLSFLPQLKRVLGSLNSKIIHSHIDTLSAIPLRFAKKQGYVIRIAHSHNSNQEYNHLLPIKLLMKKLTLSYATNLVACSYDSGYWMFGKSNPFLYLPNGIDTKKFLFNKVKREFIRNKYGWGSNVVIGHVGRFNKQKNHTFLIDVFHSLVKLRDDVVLVLIGDGPLKSNIIEKALRLNILEKITIISPLDHIDYYYSAFDYFLFPSLYEGMSLALLEAQVSGVKCIISNNITPESILKLTTTTLDIKKSPESWVSNIDFRPYDREIETLELREFIDKVDIKTTITKIREIYESNA